MSSTESTGVPHDTIEPLVEPQSQSLTESVQSNTDSIIPSVILLEGSDTQSSVHTLSCDDSVGVLLGERVEVVQEGTHAPPLSDKFHTIIPEPEPISSDVPVEVSEEGTHAPPLSEKFHSIIPEPEPISSDVPVEVSEEGTHAPPLSEKFHSIIPEPMSSGVTKRTTTQEGTKTPTKGILSQDNAPMVPQEQSLQNLSIFVYLLLPLFVVVLVILVLMWLN